MNLLDTALEWGLPKHVVLADSGYGDKTEFREQLVARGLTYVVGITGTQAVWSKDIELTPPVNSSGRGRPRTRGTYTESPSSASDLMESLPTQAPCVSREATVAHRA